jgi:hypothetical protein
MPTQRDRNHSSVSTRVPGPWQRPYGPCETPGSRRPANPRSRWAPSTRWHRTPDPVPDSAAVNKIVSTASNGHSSARVVSGPRLLDAISLLLVFCGMAWFGYTVSLPARPSELARAEAAFGIRVEKLQLGAGGFFLDCRYRVLDRDRAAGLLPPGAAAYLMSEKSSVRLEAMQVSPIADEKPATGEVLSHSVNVALFGNPGQLIKRGDRVTLFLGRFKATGLTVQ